MSHDATDACDDGDGSEVRGHGPLSAALSGFVDKQGAGGRSGPETSEDADPVEIAPRASGRRTAVVPPTRSRRADWFARRRSLTGQTRDKWNGFFRSNHADRRLAPERGLVHPEMRRGGNGSRRTLSPKPPETARGSNSTSRAEPSQSVSPDGRLRTRRPRWGPPDDLDLDDPADRGVPPDREGTAHAFCGSQSPIEFDGSSVGCAPR